MAAKRPEPPDDGQGGNRNKSRPSWRKGPVTATASKSTWASQSTSSQWSAVDTAQQRGALERRFKLAGLMIVLALLSAGFIYKVFFTPVKAPLLAVALNRFESARIAPNAWALEDVRRFAAAPGNLEVHVTTLDELGAQLKKQSPGGPGKNVTIVYLSGQGVVDEEGQPCLLGPDSDPMSSKSWIRVADLLKEITAARPGASNRKLVLLDCGRIESAWSIGVLRNDFAARLPSVIKSLSTPELTVIASASPGQQSFAAPELGATVFAYFAARGLHGEADGRGNSDGTVTLRELEKFLRTNVARWVTEYRSASQIPQLLTSRENDDFALAYVDESPLPDVDAFKLASDARWSGEIADLWASHAELKRSRVYAHAPLAFATLEARLLRLEELLLAGSAYDESYTNLKGQIDLLVSELEKPAGPELPGLSLAVWNRAENFAAARSGAKQLREVWPSPPDKPPAKLDAFGYQTRVLAGLGRYFAEPGKARLDEALGLIDGTPQTGRRTIDPIELHFARMLKRFSDTSVGDTDVAQALKLREEAESTAWPADPRVQYWTIELMKPADAGRRTAEDLLFVGGDQQLQAAATIWRDFAAKEPNAKNYRRIAEIQDELARAYALRDLALAEAPAFAQWRLGTGDPDAAVSQELKDLFSSVQKLAAALDEPLVEESIAQRLETIKANHAAARTSYDRFAGDLSRETGELAALHGSDQQRLSALERILSTPLVTGKERIDLRLQYLKLLERGAKADPSSSSETTAEAPASSDPSANEPRPEHPVFAWLQPDGEASKKEEPWHEQSGRLRKQIAEVINQTNSQIAETDKLLGVEGRFIKEDSFAARAGYARADRLVRTAASVWADWTGDNDRVEADRFAQQLQGLDAHNLLLAQSDRILDDFWGSAGQGEPYFSLAAAQCLDAAKRLLPRKAIGYREPLLAKLEDRRQAATAFRIQNARPLVDPAETGQLTLDSSAKSPAGTAAIFLQSQEPIAVQFAGDEAVRRYALPVDPKKPVAELAYRVGGEHFQSAGELQATALYRGHLSTAPISISPSKGLEIAYEPVDYPPPKVTVYGQLQETSAILFIFDCSGSMAQPKGNRRWDPAISTLKAVLDRVASEEYRVGLMLYGHQAGWNPKDTNQRRSSPYAQQFGGAAAKRLHPAEDVEIVRPIGRFRKADLADLDKYFAVLEPWGETPLCLAILQGLDHMRELDSSIDKHIVVITDGLNEQSPGTPKSPGAAAEKYKDLQDLSRAMSERRNQGVRLDVVGFDVTAGNAKERAEIDRLTQISKVTGGDFYPASDRNALLKALQDSLGLRRYVIAAKDGSSTPLPKELGTTWELPKLDRSREFAVRLLDVERPVETLLTLEGGEWPRMYVTPRSERGNFQFEHRLYDPAEHRAQFAEASSAGQGQQRTAKIGVHLPERILSNMLFRISVQASDEKQFSPRPAESWVEIQPVSQDRKPLEPRYTFYDQAFEPARPVPVLTYLCPTWPSAAQSVEVQLWCKFGRRTTPDLELTVGKLQEKPVAVAGKKFSFVKKDTDGALLSFVVLEEPAGNDPQQCKLELDPPAQKTVHRYSIGGSQITHTFVLDDALSREVNDFRLRITSKRALMDGAVQLAEPAQRLLPRQ